MRDEIESDILDTALRRYCLEIFTQDNDDMLFST